MSRPSTLGRPAFALLVGVLGSCAMPRGRDAMREPSVRKGPCPEEMALVSGFCVDRWEASLVEITADGEKDFSPYERVAMPGTPAHRVRAVSRPGVVPQGYISRDEARAACEASSKRLCTEDEWVRACKGEAKTTFPYGNERKAGYCNDAGVSPLQKFYPEAPETYTMDKMNEPRLNQVKNTVAPTGSFARCTDAWGLYDMVGNLHEWVDARTPTMRGGYYQDTRINGDGCNYQNVAHGAFYHDYSTGFRCCRDAVE